MIYLTGDTHGEFRRIEDFCARKHTTKDDIIIILGDAGINYAGIFRDLPKKRALSELPATLFCIHGNHEQRPGTLPVYHTVPWHGGRVYVEDEFPSLLFAVDGEVYDLDGLKAIAIGGAYSVDKQYRVAMGYGWWPDEQPSAEIRAAVEAKLASLGWRVDMVLSHTVPLKYEPVEVFLPGIDQSRVDKSTEIWLDGIEERLDYRFWYCGHYHTDKRAGKLRIMFHDVEALPRPPEGGARP